MEADAIRSDPYNKQKTTSKYLRLVLDSVISN